MKKIPKSSWLAVTLAATTPWAHLTAQNSEAADEEEIFELSPFTVSSEGDDGYRANSTTAGSRLNTQLKDVAASVTVLTDAFMDDLGATDLDGALSMVAGVDTDLTNDTQNISSPGGGGYIGGDFNDPNARENSVRVRGLGRATKSANYLKVRGPVDRYNMERTEFLRGPNSLLFGLGRPAGVVNYTTKKAHLRRDINKIDFVLDNFGTRRLQVDFSRTLIEDKLAARFAGVINDQRFMAETARNLDRKAYLTFKYKPFKNTVLDAYIENTTLDARKPNYRVPQDNVSDWLEGWNNAGEQLAALKSSDPDTYGDMSLEEFRERNFLHDASWPYESQGRPRPTGDYVFDERLKTDADGNPLEFEGQWIRHMDGRERALTGYYSGDATYSGGDWSIPYSPGGEGYTTLYGNITTTGRQPTNGRGGAVQPRTRLRFARSSHPFDNRDGQAFADPQVLDEGIFPFMDQELGTLPGNYRDIKSKKLGFNFEQKVNDDFYLSASYLKEDYERHQNFGPLAQTQAISIDVNRYLPGAIQNPGLFFGAPYVKDLVTLDSNGEIATRTDLPGGGTIRPTLDQAVTQAQMIVDHINAGGSLERRKQGGNTAIIPQAELQEIAANNTLFLEQVANREPNPNFLRPFFHGRHISGHEQYESESALIQANYDFDFRDRSDRLGFLGLHRLTGFGSVSKDSTLGWRASDVATYNEDLARTGENDQHSANRWFWPIFYIGDPVALGDTSLNITGLPENTRPHLDNRIGHYYYTNENSDRGEWLINEEGLEIEEGIIGRTLSFDGLEQEGYGASLQSFFWNNRIVSTIGWREDTVASIMYERLPDETPAWDKISDGDERSDWDTANPITTLEQTKALTTGSVVFHATPWLRFFYNESENFDLTSPATDGFGRNIDSQGGETTEYGVGLTLFENKLDLKFNIYETAQVNQRAGSLVWARMKNFEDTVRRMLQTLDGRFTNGDPTPYNIEDWTRVTGIDAEGNLLTDSPGYRVPELDDDGNQIIDFNGNPQWTFEDEEISWRPETNVNTTQDSVSKGWELSGTWNPTRNLRIRGSVSRLENAISNVHEETLEYVAKRGEYWNQFFDAGYHTNGHNDATVYWAEPDSPAADELPVWDTEVDGELPYNNYRVETMGAIPQPDRLLTARFWNTVGDDILNALAIQGISSHGISEYNARVVANYSFRDGFMKGFSFGTNLRWESGKGLGYDVVEVADEELPFNFPNTDVNGDGLIDETEFLAVRRDVENPIEGDSHVTGGLMVNYKGKLHGDKIDWRIQLNVDNVFKQGDDLRIIRFNSDGSPVFALNRPTTFKLTNSFRF
ncbi:TonB-dependent receptor plug domain-containing protein [Pelagicoccus sp. NFK12]|uniref:TonB-dependent receptor plug domain-containing protein n=1 Tax=Pelagicoccus enzymogenes TaxID=2773457 RepID=A0A927IHC4_9BACT|nr:TonB-dependent receptor plug domain-containing protein [Pelagicoccus enzymogenes]MBD5780031.1 TonB-dependent receptor plug domain-containing protein [Pelagicoccus enzymogenes]